MPGPPRSTTRPSAPTWPTPCPPRTWPGSRRPCATRPSSAPGSRTSARTAATPACTPWAPSGDAVAADLPDPPAARQLPARRPRPRPRRVPQVPPRRGRVPFCQANLADLEGQGRRRPPPAVEDPPAPHPPVEPAPARRRGQRALIGRSPPNRRDQGRGPTSSGSPAGPPCRRSDRRRRHGASAARRGSAVPAGTGSHLRIGSRLAGQLHPAVQVGRRSGPSRPPGRSRTSPETSSWFPCPAQFRAGSSSGASGGAGCPVDQRVRTARRIVDDQASRAASAENFDSPRKPFAGERAVFQPSARASGPPPLETGPDAPADADRQRGRGGRSAGPGDDHRLADRIRASRPAPRSRWPCRSPRTSSRDGQRPPSETIARSGGAGGGRPSRRSGRTAPSQRQDERPRGWSSPALESMTSNVRPSISRSTPGPVARNGFCPGLSGRSSIPADPRGRPQPQRSLVHQPIEPPSAEISIGSRLRDSTVPRFPSAAMRKAWEDRPERLLAVRGDDDDLRLLAVLSHRRSRFRVRRWTSTRRSACGA